MDDLTIRLAFLSAPGREASSSTAHSILTIHVIVEPALLSAHILVQLINEKWRESASLRDIIVKVDNKKHSAAPMHVKLR